MTMYKRLSYSFNWNGSACNAEWILVDVWSFPTFFLVENVVS